MPANICIELGRLTQDVKLEKVGEVTKGTFSLAVDRNYKSQGEERPKTDFIPIVMWRGSAEFAERNFKKGMMALVVGSLETYTYEKDGEKRKGFQINADQIRFAGDKKPAEDGNDENVNSNGFDIPDGFAPPPEGFDGDDLPF